LSALFISAALMLAVAASVIVMSTSDQ